MKDYRKHLKFETVVLAVASLALLAVQVLGYSRVIRPLSGEHWVDFWNGMISGAACGIMVLFLVGIVTNLRALANEKRLKKLYAKENDERTTQIVEKAQSMGMRISVPVMLAAGIVLGYFDIGMSIVCLCCAVGQSVITVIAKLYWHHQM